MSLEIHASILAFDLNKKVLLFKFMTKQFKKLLDSEFINNFGDPYSKEADSESNLFYQYFSPLISSFEISKDINFVYEHVLLNNSQYILRFNPYKNCLILCFYDSNQFQFGYSHSTIARSVHNEFFTSWHCKSLVTLIKYKFGICYDEKCFVNQGEIQRLILKWSNLFTQDHAYFLETIEQLDINEDIRVKCESFMMELVEFLSSRELVMGQLDDIDKNILKVPDEENDMFLPNHTHEFHSQKSKFIELEKFFTDLQSIDQFVLSYGSKLLHIYTSKKNQLESSIEVTDKLLIDSSSLFMLLLEATEFLDDQTIITDEQEFSKDNPETISLELDDYESDRSKEIFSTPVGNINQSLNEQLEKIEENIKFTKLKKTHAFLRDSNKSLGYYDILFLRLNENMCLTMIKSNRLSKYCQLMSEFDKAIGSFLELIDRKRIELNDSEVSQSTDVTENMINQSRSNGNAAEEKSAKAFLSFFMNRIIGFFNKLNNLKSDLINTEKVDQPEKEKFLTRKKSRQSSDAAQGRRLSQITLTNGNYVVNQKLVAKEKKIEQLQVKINKLTSGKEFKQFFEFINNENSKDSKSLEDSGTLRNGIYTYLRMIETQLSMIRVCLDELFYEIFLANTNSMNSHNFNKIFQLRNSTTPAMDSKSALNIYKFVSKSAHVIENLQRLYKKNLFHYTPFIELKLNRNIAISFYWHSYPGLIHFSIINRQKHTCFIPTIDMSPKFNIPETAIKTAYQKYSPLIQIFLYKYNCSQFQFTDDQLKLSITYIIWFEDKKSNYIPVDFNSLAFNANSTDESYKSPSPGITDKSFYDILPKICYPNAPENSLCCYELYCLHSSSVSETKIKNQLNMLMLNFPRKSL